MMIQGKIYWAKLGKPQPGYDKTQKEWSFDVAIDAATKKKLLAEGMSEDYIKNKGTGHASGGDFIQLKRKAIKQDGAPAKPIAVVDNQRAPWNPDKPIGNGSVVNVMLALNERLAPRKGLKPSALKVQVWELVEYEGDGEYEEFPSANEEEWEAA